MLIHGGTFHILPPWFNKLWSKSVKTKISKYFLQLIKNKFTLRSKILQKVQQKHCEMKLLLHAKQNKKNTRNSTIVRNTPSKNAKQCDYYHYYYFHYFYLFICIRLEYLGTQHIHVFKKLQPFTKYLRQTLVFIWNSALREKFNFCFWRDFLLVVVKERLVKHQKVSKYYENDYLKNFLLLFMSLLTAAIVKNSHI